MSHRCRTHLQTNELIHARMELTLRFRAKYDVCVKFQGTSQWLALDHNNNKTQSMPVSAQSSLKYKGQMHVSALVTLYNLGKH